MEMIKEKSKEVLASLIPIIILVIILNFTIAPTDGDVFIRFLIGGLLIFLGLSIFLIGVEIAMERIGNNMAKEIVTSKNVLRIILLAFILGFLITVAEPDLLILGQQIENASGEILTAQLIVYIVSFGVGVMISLGVYWVLKNRKYNIFMTIVYAVIFFLALFASEEFLAISFDASGATTGALTTPFILALSGGIAKFKGGKKAEEDAFGLVGIMSSGPILAVILLSIITKQEHIQGAEEVFVQTQGVIKPILNELSTTFPEALIAILPISLLFFIFNIFKFKLDKEELIKILVGLVLTVLGLGLFLGGVNGGFMEMGFILGMEIAENYASVLPAIGLIMGMIVVLAEPAVLVLGQQIEDVTGGAIAEKVIKITLSIGVGIAISLSMLRIMIPALKLWHFLLPGFLIGILLSYYVDPIFAGIGFDAGGVASGPMTATFILAFAQGAASMIPTASVIVDGFGVIAMVAMTPILSIMILGSIYKIRVKKEERVKELETEKSIMPIYDIEGTVIFAIVDRGKGEVVVDIARENGATGASILHGRRSDHPDIKILDMELQNEKEIVIFATSLEKADKISDVLLEEKDLITNEESLFVLPTDYAMKTYLS